MTGLAGLMVGLAPPAAAQPPAPPGADYCYQQSFTVCAERPPAVNPVNQAVSGNFPCFLRYESDGKGNLREVKGISYTVYDKVYQAPADQAPGGYVDGCDATNIYGWTKDPDWAGSLDVHLYNQNDFVRPDKANGASEPGTGGPNQRFVFPHGQGPGAVLTVYALGVDAAGSANGANPALPRSDGSGATTCTVP